MLGLILAPKTETSLFIFAGIFGLLWLSTVPLTSSLVGDIFGARFMATLVGIGSYDAIWYLSILLGLLSALFHWPIADRRVALVPAS